MEEEGEKGEAQEVIVDEDEEIKNFNFTYVEDDLMSKMMKSSIFNL
jgi:hypothetical protein